MNVFCTNEDPVQSAREHCYRHVVKMILESHQLLATAHRVLDGDSYADSTGLMKKISNPSHPSSKWTMDSQYHYKWLFIMLCELHRMYEHKSGKVHASKVHLKALGEIPNNIPDNGFVLPTPAMPDKFKAYAIFEGRCKAYQMYLKDKFAEWGCRSKPLRVEFVYDVPDWY